MEFPFGHHRRDDAVEEEPQRFSPRRPDFDRYDAPPPSQYEEEPQRFSPPRPDFDRYDAPPPSQYEEEPQRFSPPRPDFDPYDATPRPQYEDNQYEGNTYGGGGGYAGEENEYRPEVEDEGYGDGRGGCYRKEEPSYDGGFPNRQPTVRIFTKAREDFSLTIREGEVVLAPADPSDEYQHWIKDMRYSTKVQDEEGLPSFALVNKVTGEAIKHATEQSLPVRLVPYNPDYLDESVLWTQSHDTGEDFRCIRMVNNIGLNFDAFHGDEDHGGVRDGTTVVLWEWTKGDNQRWKVVPY